jgi:outer membrane lipoprotein carrier protein
MMNPLYWLLCVTILLAFKSSNEQSAMYKVLNSIHKIHIFKANFVYTSREVGDEQDKIQESIQGEIWVKDNKYHLLLEQQEIICNGQMIWNYLPQAQEVQIDEYDPEQESLDPIKLLTLYRSGFTPVNLKTEQIRDHICDVIELVASDPENSIRRIILTIDQKEKKIRHLEALDTDQYWHVFRITKFEAKEKLPDHLFEFDLEKYPNIEVIDLR